VLCIYDSEKTELYFGRGGSPWLSVITNRELKIKSTRIPEFTVGAAGDRKWTTVCPRVARQRVSFGFHSIFLYTADNKIKQILKGTASVV
jgi:hypothetical protein